MYIMGGMLHVYQGKHVTCISWEACYMYIMEACGGIKKKKVFRDYGCYWNYFGRWLFLGQFST